MKAIDLEFVKATLLELDPSLEGSEEEGESYNTALVLVSALVCGPCTTRLAEFTKLPPEFVATIRQRMIQAELWTELAACCDHWYVAAGLVHTTAFCLDVLIAQGIAVRQWSEEEGQYRYWHVASAPEREQREDRVN